MSIRNILFCCATLAFVSGCSGTYHSYIENLRLAFNSNGDVLYTLKSIANSKVDLIEVKNGERSKALMALSFIEGGQYKWVSRDQAVLIIDAGRIVRTLGFSKNLLHLSSNIYDPLKEMKSLGNGNISSLEWTREADWDGDEYGHEIVSKFKEFGSDYINSMSMNIETRLVIEELEYTPPSNYIRFDKTWKNYFWYEKTSGQLIKSIQTLSPIGEQIEITYVSRIARFADKLITQ
jgi:hypothetical protein